MKQNTTYHITLEPSDDLIDNKLSSPRDPSGKEGPGESATWTRSILSLGQTNLVWDRDVVKGWNSILNSLLVFTGVLSVILAISINTLFQKMHEINTRTTFSLLQETLAQLNRAHLSGESVTADMSRPIPTVISRELFPDANLVYFFWWFGLIVSLATAMGAAILKLWLSVYISSTISGSLIHERSVAKRSCLKILKWSRIPLIINILAGFVRLALADFFSGLLISFGVYYITAGGITGLVAASIFPHLVPFLPRV